MNGNVVDLAEIRRRDEPHSSGMARCLACNHEYVAVAPTGVTWMECPSCHLMRSRFFEHHERVGEPHWHCLCGNELFYVVKEGCYCPNCGEWQKGF